MSGPRLDPEPGLTLRPARYSIREQQSTLKREHERA